jgi:secondary thiamine-phosphate synthase enzyme
MKIIQKEISVTAPSRGFHIITSEIIRALPELTEFAAGMANIFIKHTSASLAVNENADPTVRADMEEFFNRNVPEDGGFYLHTDEGPDDMTSHIKNTLIGSSLNIPVTMGRLNLGTWQGIYLCEHRNHPRPRTIVITVTGE